MRRRLLPVALAVVVAGCGGAGGPTPFRLGEYWRNPSSLDAFVATRLVWKEAGPKPLRLPFTVTGRLFSRDRRRVVFGDYSGELVLVDLVRRRVIDVLRPWGEMPESCDVHPLVWTTDDRIVATIWCGWAHGTTESSIATVDLRSGRTLVARRIGGIEHALWLRRRGVLLVTGPPSLNAPGRTGLLERVGPARLIRVSPSGRVAIRRIRVRAGQSRDRTLIRVPGAALFHGRVYVLGEDDPIAVVDPANLAVSYGRVLTHAHPELAGAPHAHLGTNNPAREAYRFTHVVDGELVVTGFDVFTRHGYDRRARAPRVVLTVPAHDATTSTRPSARSSRL